jgi:hypothetical protein
MSDNIRWYKHYTVRIVFWSSIFSVLFSILLAYLHLIEPKTVKDLSATLVTVSITLGGFFLTALSILAGFSSTKFMQEILDMKEAYHEMLRTFFATIIVNLIVVIVAITCAIRPLNEHYTGWKTFASLLPFFSCLLFILSLILTGISLHGFYGILKRLAK